MRTPAPRCWWTRAVGGPTTTRHRRSGPGPLLRAAYTSEWRGCWGASPNSISPFTCQLSSSRSRRSLSIKQALLAFFSFFPRATGTSKFQQIVDRQSWEKQEWKRLWPMVVRGSSPNSITLNASLGLCEMLTHLKLSLELSLCFDASLCSIRNQKKISAHSSIAFLHNGWISKQGLEILGIQPNNSKIM